MAADFSDIVGTCFGYEAPIEAMTEKFGDKLRSQGLHPQLFFHALQLAAERDLVYMDLAGQEPVSLPERWIENFAKTLYQAGLSREVVDSIFNEDDAVYVTNAWVNGLRPRPGFAEMLEIFDEGGIDFYAASGASPARVRNYFDQAAINLPDDRTVDFLSVGVHKPAAAPYKFIREKYGDKYDTIIFQASHNWDLAGAKKNGFETAYVTVYEYKPCEKLWGAPDVTADDLPSLARVIVAKWGKGAK